MTFPLKTPKALFSAVPLTRFSLFTLLLSLFTALCLSLSPIMDTPALAGHGHGNADPAKSAILLVAFGTSVPSAQKSFDNIDAIVRQEFPGVEVRWAYTSHIIRTKLAKQGKNLLSPAQALSGLLDEGYNRVAVQSLHSIPGEEYHKLVETVNAFRSMPDGFNRLAVGLPLLAVTGDLNRVSAALMAIAPTQRKPGEALVFMGHGTHHPGNVYYEAMQYRLDALDPLAFMGTVEGSPTLDDVAAKLAKAKVRKAYLLPFMSVAGDHATNDMAGPEEDSWKSVLEKQGIACVPVLKGTAEYKQIVAVWVDHLKAAMHEIQD